MISDEIILLYYERKIEAIIFANKIVKLQER